MKKKKKINKYFELLYNSIIIGYVDNNGAVHSKEIHYSKDVGHKEFFGIVTKAWRWTCDKGVINLDELMEIDDWDFVKRHLESEYGIKFMENGFHDIEYLQFKSKE